MKLNPQYLPKADVVFTVMFLDKALCEKTLQIILGEKIELVDAIAEAKNDLHKAALNAIYFDIKTKTVDGRIVTLDLQRKYIKDRVRKRTVYYACREISAQEVKHGKYENLKNVVVTFLLTEASLKTTKDNRKILLQDSATGDVYTDMLTIHEVSIQHINSSHSDELQTLKAFFAVDNQTDFDDFIQKYGNTPYGRLLLDAYNDATRNSTLLDNLSEEEKYMIRLTDEERLEERAEGRAEGREEGKKTKAIEIAANLLSMDMPLFAVAQATGLSEKELEQLRNV
jgi:predicted transposase/invertase (TIGR01784 family)